MANTIPLSQTQIQKLAVASQRARAAEAEAQQQRAILNDLIEMTLDAHGAPQDAQIDLQRGVLILPEPDAPQSEDAGVESGDAPDTGQENTTAQGAVA